MIRGVLERVTVHGLREVGRFDSLSLQHKGGRSGAPGLRLFQVPEPVLWFTLNLFIEVLNSKG